MRAAVLTFLMMSSPAFAAPAVALQSQDGVTLMVPAEWKLLVTASEHSAVMSKDASTTINIRWFPYGERITVDDLLNKLVKVTDDNVPFGDVKETRRYAVVSGRGKLAEAEYAAPLGYTMKMGFVVIPDKAKDRIFTAILLTPPETWTDLDAGALLVKVADGVVNAP